MRHELYDVTSDGSDHNDSLSQNVTLQHNGPSARAQPVKAVSVTGSERRSTDGAAAYWRPSKYSSSGKLPRDWLQLATKCIILSMYLITDGNRSLLKSKQTCTVAHADRHTETGRD